MCGLVKEQTWRHSRLLPYARIRSILGYDVLIIRIKAEAPICECESILIMRRCLIRNEKTNRIGVLLSVHDGCAGELTYLWLLYYEVMGRIGEIGAEATNCNEAVPTGSWFYIIDVDGMII